MRICVPFNRNMKNMLLWLIYVRDFKGAIVLDLWPILESTNRTRMRKEYLCTLLFSNETFSHQSLRFIFVMLDFRIVTGKYYTKKKRKKIRSCLIIMTISSRIDRIEKFVTGCAKDFREKLEEPWTPPNARPWWSVEDSPTIEGYRLS